MKLCFSRLLKKLRILAEYDDLEPIFKSTEAE